MRSHRAKMRSPALTRDVAGIAGRMIVTPHVAFFSPSSFENIRTYSAETIRNVLVEGQTYNVIPAGSE